MADDLRTLLMYIVEHPVMQSETREAELDATAVQDVDREIKEIAQDQRADAERLAPYFARGLRQASRGPLVVEDTTPDGNGIAEAFARFLVATNLASSQSEPLPNGHFRYTFDVNWPALRDLARNAGIDLDAALGSAL
jgi:hypothetical protein